MTSWVKCLVVIAFAVTDCGGATPTSRQYLWLPPGATARPPAIPTISPDGTYADGSADLAFQIESRRFEDISEQLERHFEDAEWRRRETQYLNPTSATSFRSGWVSRCGCVRPAGVTDHVELHEWIGEWQNTRGDVIRYWLMAQDNVIRGSAAFVPARLVRHAERVRSRQR